MVLSLVIVAVNDIAAAVTAATDDALSVLEFDPACAKCLSELALLLLDDLRPHDSIHVLDATDTNNDLCAYCGVLVIAVRELTHLMEVNDPIIVVIPNNNNCSRAVENVCF